MAYKKAAKEKEVKVRKPRAKKDAQSDQPIDGPTAHDMRAASRGRAANNGMSTEEKLDALISQLKKHGIHIDLEGE
jgi:hypothetical protein